MYTFSIEKGHIPLIKVTVISEIVEKDGYLKGLVEKCFERVFTMIREAKEEKDSSEEADLEDDD